jgi:hypothetical protein
MKCCFLNSRIRDSSSACMSTHYRHMADFCHLLM